MKRIAVTGGVKRKKILWLLPYYPYPLITGGNVRIFNLIKYLSEYYDMYILSYFDKEIKDAHIKALEKYCRKVIVVERKLREGDLPLIFRHYYTPEMIKELESVIKDNFDFIQIDFLTMAYYIFMLKRKVRIPVFFTEHDVSSFDFEKCFHNRHLKEKERYIEWVKMHKVIDKIYPLFNAILTVSHNDAKILKEKYPDLNIYAAPTGTDCKYYSFRSRTDKIKNLIYVGHYIHYPNLDSVQFFLNDILPLIECKYPKMKFYIVGSGGKKTFKELNKNNVEVTGTVPDIRKYLYKDGIFVAPIRLGIGIRGKILEAMSTGLPVVSTSLGAKGIGAKSGTHLLVADSPMKFAQQIEKLIKDKNLRNKLTCNAEKFVKDNYNWPVVVKNLVGIYEEFFNV